MNQKDRSERNFRVVLMRMRQVPTKEVAEAFGITERQVRRIMSDWREGSLKQETEDAVKAVDEALSAITEDMVALGIAATKAEPGEMIEIQCARIGLMRSAFSILLDAGVSFEGLFKDRDKDMELVTDVNAAIRSTLNEHGVDYAAIVAAIEAGMDAFAKWGYEEPGASTPFVDIWGPK